VKYTYLIAYTKKAAGWLLFKCCRGRIRTSTRQLGMNFWNTLYPVPI